MIKIKQYKGIDILNGIITGEVIEGTRFRLLDVDVNVGVIYHDGTLSTYGSYGESMKIIVKDIGVGYFLGDKMFEIVK